jgi:hypothetical protein
MANYTTSNYNPRQALRVSNVVTNRVLIATNQNLVAGNVLGIVTASGKAIISLPGASDGSQVPYGVVLTPINTTSTGYNADTACEIMVAGSVDYASLLPNVGWTQDTLRLAFKPQGIHVINSALSTTQGVI